MEPKFVSGNVRANCPDCEGAVTTFEYQTGTSEFGSIQVDGHFVEYKNKSYRFICYKLLRCANCHRGGLAKVYFNNTYTEGVLEWFFPTATETLPLPTGVPQGILAEFREAEACVNVGAWRAGSALLRSTLEKLLKSNGYTGDTLASRIEAAGADGVITESRKQRAHDDIRVLGNDILHDAWREVSKEEFDVAHHYVQRIAEDLYDDRATVEKTLRTRKRIT